MKKVLFLGKKNDHLTTKALDFCSKHFDVNLLTDDFYWSEYDYILSYLYPHVLDEKIIKNAKIAAINFHPAPPKYPGTGCINFALYNKDTTYGVTAHHMDKKVDSGKIIETLTFPIYESDTVATLLERTYAHQFVLFHRVMAVILADKNFPTYEGDPWRDHTTTRKDLDALSIIPTECSEDEMKRRIRATTYGPWKPKVLLHGRTFELKCYQ